MGRKVTIIIPLLVTSAIVGALISEYAVLVWRKVRSKL